jgi:hypothetical protein
MNHDFSILTDAFSSLASVWICPCEDEIDDQLYFPSSMFDGPVLSIFEDIGIY